MNERDVSDCKGGDRVGEGLGVGVGVWVGRRGAAGVVLGRRRGNGRGGREGVCVFESNVSIVMEVHSQMYSLGFCMYFSSNVNVLFAVTLCNVTTL